MRTKGFVSRVAIAAFLFCFAASNALAAGTLRITGGQTKLAIDPSFIGVAQSQGATLTPILPARFENGAFVLPVTGGVVQKPAGTGEITHAGGLRVTTTTTIVEVTSFSLVYDGTNPVLTGLLTVDGRFYGRVPLFDVRLPQTPFSARPDVNREVVVPAVPLTLNTVAVRALNTAFNTTSFSAGMTVGTADFAITVAKSKTRTPK